MTTMINVQEAKTRLSELLKRVEAGETIVIARAGKPVAELNPTSPPEPQFGTFKELGPVPDTFFEDLPEDELALWEGSADE